MLDWILRRFSAWTPQEEEFLVPFPENLGSPKHTEGEGIVVAFHTPDDIYAKEAARLRASAERLLLPITIRELPSTGEWVRNAALKPNFLVEARQSFRGPLLYVDADAVFHTSPWTELLQLHGDIAVYRENGEL